ncbi:S8 family serine peptidase [Natrinema gelatinilyticum]|uniref:S8 family serine peptidase n=1 Tax=Natrinema gelatinilyticum TaxID=2961571 RepID=UPI0020C35077|nr:S8 family serine peptidase [Natrinema gelatinilyticum]
MDTITLKRGQETVQFEKHPEYFAVRLNQGAADDEESLETATGTSQRDVHHVESVPEERFDIFAVADPDELEETMDETRDAPASDIVTHVYTMHDGSGEGMIPTGTMTVQFKPDVAIDEQNEILAEFGLEVLTDLDFLPDGYTVRLTHDSTENPLKIADKLQDRTEIETAEPDLQFQIQFYRFPADTLYQEQWHLNNRGDVAGLTAGADVKAEGAWEYTMGTRDVTVCVTDDGFDLEHSDFDAPGKIVGPANFGEDGDLDDVRPVQRSDNHGTACAGVAIAEANGTGVVGLAPGCSFMPVRTSKWLSDPAIVSVFQHAIRNDADVISCSWGAAGSYFPLSTQMNAIIRTAARQGRRNGKGCVILFAAGNADLPLDGEKEGTRSHQGFALHPDVIAIGASNSHDKRSSYSNYGPELTVCAPSSGSPGRGIVTTDRRGWQGYTRTDYTQTFGGTSSATPLVAGLAALLLSLDPELSSVEVKRILTTTADKIDEDDGEYEDGHSPWYGHGRINAQRATALLAGDGDEEFPNELSLNHRINRSIPETGEIEDTIDFPLNVTPKRVEVSIKIRQAEHDTMQVILIPPAGEEIILTERLDGPSATLYRRFRSGDNPEKFKEALENSAEGSWRLRIRDTAEEPTGTLEKWGLAVAHTESNTE